MKLARACVLAWCMGATLLGGCSLIVDFDRSELVDAGVDGGFDLSDAGLDGAVEDAGTSSATAEPEEKQPSEEKASAPR